MGFCPSSCLFSGSLFAEVGRASAFSSLATDLVVALPDQFFIDFVSALEQKVGQEVSRVVWHFLAQVYQAFSQVWYNLVHQVLPYRLRPFVKQVALVLTDLLKFSLLAFFTLDTFFLCLFLVDLAFSGFHLTSPGLLFFTLNKSLDFVDFAGRIFLTFLGFLSGEHFLLLFLGQVIVLNDIELSFRAIDLAILGRNLSFTGLPLRLPVDGLQELVVRVSNQVQTAWLAILLQKLVHTLQSLLNVLALVGIVKKHAVFGAD